MNYSEKHHRNRYASKALYPSSWWDFWLWHLFFFYVRLWSFFLLTPLEEKRDCSRPTAAARGHGPGPHAGASSTTYHTGLSFSFVVFNDLCLWTSLWNQVPCTIHLDRVSYSYSTVTLMFCPIPLHMQVATFYLLLCHSKFAWHIRTSKPCKLSLREHWVSSKRGNRWQHNDFSNTRFLSVIMLLFLVFWFRVDAVGVWSTHSENLLFSFGIWLFHHCELSETVRVLYYRVEICVM